MEVRRRRGWMRLRLAVRARPWMSRSRFDESDGEVEEGGQRVVVVRKRDWSTGMGTWRKGMVEEEEGKGEGGGGGDGGGGRSAAFAALPSAERTSRRTRASCWATRG